VSIGIVLGSSCTSGRKRQQRRQRTFSFFFLFALLFCDAAVFFWRCFSHSVMPSQRGIEHRLHMWASQQGISVVGHTAQRVVHVSTMHFCPTIKTRSKGKLTAKLGGTKNAIWAVALTQG